MPNKFLKIINTSLLGLILGFFALAVFVPLASAQTTAPYDCYSSDKECPSGSKWTPRSEPAASLCPEGQGRCIVPPPVIDLNVKIPGLGSSVTDIDSYIGGLFRWLLGAGGVVAAVVIMWGGYIYITAAGNQARISQAKETITGGLVGLVLLFGSVTILEFLNERLTTSAPIYVDAVKSEKLNVGFCENSPSNSVCGNKTKDSVNGSECISAKCDNGKICMPIANSFGLGLNTGENNAFECVTNTIEELRDSCKESTIQYCDYISEAMFKLDGNPLRSIDACGYGGSTCKIGNGKTKTPLNCESGYERVSCSACGAVNGVIGPYFGTIESLPGIGAGSKFVKDKDEDEEKYTIYCVDNNTTTWTAPNGNLVVESGQSPLYKFQVNWDESEWNYGTDYYSYGGICCSNTATKENITYVGYK